ncbi:hypothetical protein J6590_062608 [Homalodisca vitripennis]|nr:hypothetical protein J6590_062608 [Homalodisca vitripennis]
MNSYIWKMELLQKPNVMYRDCSTNHRPLIVWLLASHRPAAEICYTVRVSAPTAWIPIHQDLKKAVVTHSLNHNDTFENTYSVKTYSASASKFHMDSTSDLQLLYKFVNGKLDCPDLLRQVNFYIPRGTRSKAVFGRVYRPTSYASNCGLARMQRTGGLVCAGLDFFRGSWLSFKWRCSRVLT